MKKALKAETFIPNYRKGQNMENLANENVHFIKLKKQTVKNLPRRALIIDDDVTMRPLMEYIVNKAMPGAYVDWADGADSAIKLIEDKINANRPYDIVIADVFLSSQKTGIDLWRDYSGAGLNFLLISAIHPAKFRGMLRGTERPPIFLQKPILPDECAEILQIIVNRPEFS